MRVKRIYIKDKDRYSLSDFPNFSITGNVYGMKHKCYGADSLLVVCGQWIYNVTSHPEIYHAAH